MITSSLRDAIAAIEGLGESYNVITLSFDPDDTVEDLRAYRERMELPAGTAHHDTGIGGRGEAACALTICAT